MMINYIGINIIIKSDNEVLSSAGSFFIKMYSFLLIFTRFNNGHKKAMKEVGLFCKKGIFCISS